MSFFGIVFLFYGIWLYLFFYSLTFKSFVVVFLFFFFLLSYVLLHHVMGELEGIKGAWGYVEGGMGEVSMAIARAAASRGAEIFTGKVSGENLYPQF